MFRGTWLLKVHLVVLVLYGPRGFAQTKRPAAPTTGPSLLITTNQACSLQVDGESKGSLAQSGVLKVRVQTGEHLVTCTAVNGPDVVEAQVTISSVTQQIVKLDLQGVIDKRTALDAQRARDQAVQQAAAARAAAARQQREQFQHQFDAMDANATLGWINRFAQQHLSLYVGLQRDAQIGFDTDAIGWAKECPNDRDSGDSHMTYSNCRKNLPLANVVTLQSLGDKLRIGGSVQLCYHETTVTETTTNLPFIGEQTRTRQYDSNGCGNFYSDAYYILAGDPQTTAAEYQALALAFRRLAVLQRADLRN